MRRISTLLLAAGLLTSSAALAKDPAKKTPAAKQAKKPKAPPPKKVPPVSADAKKKLAGNMAGFKWGMTKDEVIASLQKDLDARYEDKIKGTTDIPMQDRLRKEKKAELGRI
ncbi:MAG TPA: hypothetical protein VK427_22485, partial [Kofleriaceae bacterium]|nr:hypothetical protein [Kofleriaceae bacterium]